MLKDPNVERYVSERLEPLAEQIKELQATIFRLMQVNNLHLQNVIERNFTTKEVVALFQKLEEQRSHYYAEDAYEILPLDEFLKSEGLIE